MKRLHWVLHLLALSIAYGSSSVSAQAGSSLPARKEAAVCRYETAVSLPARFTSGVWNDGRLLIVDLIDRKLVEVSKNGIASDVRTAIGEYLAETNISRIRPVADDGGKNVNAMVGFTGGRFLALGPHLTPKGTFATATNGLQSEAINGLIDWVLTDDGTQVLGYAHIRDSEAVGLKGLKNGFVRFDLENPRAFSVVRERSFPDSALLAMNLGYPMIAAIASTGYVALVDNQMGLWRFGPKDQELQPMHAFPKHLDGRLAPMLPSFATVEEFPRTMRAVERATMPAGLLAWDKALFLLSRTVEQGQRKWYLSKIDPFRDELLWTVSVPTKAHHLTVIPGPDEWAFFEQGPVAVPLNQTTHHIRFVNSSRMKAKSLASLCN